MLLSTIEQIKALPVHTVLYYINPFDCGYNIQNKIKMHSLIILSHNKDSMEVFNIERKRLSNEHYSFLTNGTVQVTNTKSKAELTLCLVHNGVFKSRVKAYHDSCKAMFSDDRVG